MKNSQRYFNFPVNFLQNAFKDIRLLASDIMAYAGYVYTTFSEEDTEIEQMKEAADFFDITWGNADRSYKRGKELFNSIPKNAPMVGINKDILFDFYKNPKSDDAIAALLAFLSLKSIIGDKPYVKLTNDFLIARMGGYASKNDVPESLPEPLTRYTTRRKLDSIKLELQANWNINIYSVRTRGYYVSLDKTFSLDSLVLEIEKRKKKYIESQLKLKKEVARKKALEKLKNGQQ